MMKKTKSNSGQPLSPGLGPELYTGAEKQVAGACAFCLCFSPLLMVDMTNCFMFLLGLLHNDGQCALE